MIEFKTLDEIDAMRAAGIVVADALSAVKAEAQVSVSLIALDQVARDVLADAGASSPFLGYRPGFAGTPFPAVICTSVNDAVLHGIPDGYRLRDGDLLSIDFGGHGVGHAMHESPSVPNEGRPGRGVRLQPGLVIAIEPWFLGGGHDEYRVDRDGWTLRSGDGSRGVHVEHTVAITPDGPRILTRQLDG